MREKVAKIFSWLLLAPALIPLIYLDGLLYPYLSPKTFLFRGLGVLVLASFVFLVGSGHPFYWQRLKNKISWLPAGLLLIAYVASIFGLDFYHSFWSIFNRGDGLLTLSVAVLFFYLLLLSANQKFILKLFKVIAWVASLVALQAFFQWVQTISGVDLPLISETSGRLGGVLGNAAFLAGYLSLTAVVTFLIAKGCLQITWKRLAHASVALQLLVVLLTATRGSILALIATGFLFVVYLSFSQVSSQRVKIWSRSSVVAVLIIAGLFVTFRSQLTEVPFSPVRRLASISFSDSTVANRLFVWQGLLGKTLSEHLILGYGSENINVPFNEIYNPNQISEQWFDRTHNSFLDYFVQYGLLGLIVYLAVILSVLYLGFKIKKKSTEWGLYLIVFALIYTIQNLFIFDTAMTFWLLLVMLVFALIILDELSVTVLALPKHSQKAGSVIAVLVILLLLPVSIQPLRANLLLADGYMKHISNVGEAVASMEKGLSLGTYADLEYGYQAFSMYTDRQVSMLSGSDRAMAFNYASSILSKNLERYSYDARTATYLAHVLDLTPPEAVRDEIKLREAIDRAIELSPRSLQPRLLKANIAIRQGDSTSGQARVTSYHEAIQGLEDYLEIVNDSSEVDYVIANLYFLIGDRTMANDWAIKGEGSYKGGSASAQRATGYYIKTEDWPNALRFLKDFVEDNPGDYNSLFDLAKLYFLTGDIATSRAIVERLKIEKPGLLETDPAFQSAIQSAIQSS